MHSSSFENMRRFVENHLSGLSEDTLKIADIGSQDVNGSYQPLFERAGWTYIGVDMEAGKNVDIVLADIYAWDNLGTGDFDVVVSGQAFEHIEFFWLTMMEVARIMRPGGLCCLIAPSGGFEHRYPVDCWRFYPDGMRALARYAGLEVVEAYAEWDREKFPTMDPVWQDCVLIARKPKEGDVARAQGAELHAARASQPPPLPPGRPPGHEQPAPTTYRIDRMPDEGNPAGIAHWHLDSPRSNDPVEKRGDGHFMLRGWALSTEGAPVHVAVREGGQTKSYPMTTFRADVITAVLKEEPEHHPCLRCGFELELPISSRIEFGFEVDSRITWIHHLTRTTPST